MPETETPEVVEITKPSKLERIKSVAWAAGFYGTMAAITGGSMYYGYKVQKLNLDAAKLNLEAAKRHFEA